MTGEQVTGDTRSRLKLRRERVYPFRHCNNKVNSATESAVYTPSFRKEVGSGIRHIFLCRFIFNLYDDGTRKRVPSMVCLTAKRVTCSPVT